MAKRRITMITLENFKGISEPVEIPLRPITLLFGKNSAGKSTILQAMLYVREILCTGRVDVDRVGLGDDVINLGGFRNFVHCHDINRAVRIRFDIDLGDTGLETFDGDYGEFVSSYSKFDRELGNIKNVYVEFEIIMGASKSVSKTCNIGIDDELAITIKWNDDKKEFVSYILGTYLNKLKEQINEEMELDIIIPDTFTSSDPIQSIGHFLNYNINDSVDQFVLNHHDNDSVQKFFIKKASENILNRYIMCPLECLKNLLEPVRYIGPIREIPPRDNGPRYTQNNERWAKGLAAWDILMNPKLKNSEKFLQKVNTALEKLQLDYELRQRHFLALDINDEVNIDELRILTKRLANGIDNEQRLKEHLDGTSKLKGNVQVYLKEKKKNIEVALCDIGVGISQVIPIVVGVLAKKDPDTKDPDTEERPSILAIEQPELHVHPAVQCELGDLFIRERSDDRIFLIETHSEHLLLRIQKRINQTYKNEAPEYEVMKPEDISVLYVEQKDGETSVDSYYIDQDGIFSCPLPNDFFEERSKEWFD